MRSGDLGTKEPAYFVIMQGPRAIVAVKDLARATDMLQGLKQQFPGQDFTVKIRQGQLSEERYRCAECGGDAVMIMADLEEAKKDACYYKVRSRYKVWPSAYASGALVQCRKKGASNWGTKAKKESLATPADVVDEQQDLARLVDDPGGKFDPINMQFLVGAFLSSHKNHDDLQDNLPEMIGKWLRSHAAELATMGFSTRDYPRIQTLMHEIMDVDAVFEGEDLEENLRKWFREKWVRFGPDGKIRGDCARGSDSEGKPKCLPQKKAYSLGKKGRASAAARKRRQDPNPDRRGAAKNVATKKESVTEEPNPNYSKFQNQIQNMINQNTAGDPAEKLAIDLRLLGKFLASDQGTYARNVLGIGKNYKAWIEHIASWLKKHQRGLQQEFTQADLSDLQSLASDMYELYLAKLGKLEEENFVATNENTDSAASISQAVDQLDELKKATINDYLSKSSAAVRGGRKEVPKRVPSWKVAAGKVNPNSELSKYAKIKAGDLQGMAEGADLDAQAMNIATKLTTGKNLEKLRGMAHDSTVYRALDRYFAKHNIPETIYNRVANIVFKKINQQGVAEDSDKMDPRPTVLPQRKEIILYVDGSEVAVYDELADAVKDARRFAMEFPEYSIVLKRDVCTRTNLARIQEGQSLGDLS